MLIEVMDINDYDIQALVDSELDDVQESHVRAEIRHSPASKERYEQLCAQKLLLQRWWKFQQPRQADDKIM
ncbi:MAG: hypothetical protein GC136_00830 [Alphaproteobacteria bacterium]|nr:hypothetical protein [Alphaproteobacteria bacterium]